MCGRFAQFNPIDYIREAFSPDVVTSDLAPSWNIAPSQNVLCLIYHNQFRLGQLPWSLHPFSRTQKSGKAIINIRSETLFEKPLFKNAAIHKRCLIPASGFYEWQVTENGRQPWFIHSRNSPLVAFAGIWESWNNVDGTRQYGCAVITCKATGIAAEIHDRMPVIFSPETALDWLSNNKNNQALKTIMESTATSDLTAIPVSTHVNNPGNNSEQCIAPVR